MCKSSHITRLLFYRYYIKITVVTLHGFLKYPNNNTIIDDEILKTFNLKDKVYSKHKLDTCITVLSCVYKEVLSVSNT